jgi:SAM-dependent methyltransferase
MSTHTFNSSSRPFLGKAYRAAFWCWRCLPGAVRDGLSRNYIARTAKVTIRDLLVRYAGRDDVYNAKYYAYVDEHATRSAPTIASSIVDAFHPSKVVDVGCGTGALLAEFRKCGVSGIGLEYSASALEICRSRGLDVRQFDIESASERSDESCDVVTCFEVAEHLHADFADTLVSMLTSMSKCVVFTAAVPGQGGGADHVNEQPHEYWIEKFRIFSFRIDSELSAEWRTRWQEQGVASFYSNNVMVFYRESPEN